MPFKDEDYKPEELEAIQNWTMPQNDEEMEEFLRFGETEAYAAKLIAYYRAGRKIFELDMLDAASYAVRSVDELESASEPPEFPDGEFPNYKDSVLKEDEPSPTPGYPSTQADRDEPMPGYDGED